MILILYYGIYLMKKQKYAYMEMKIKYQLLKIQTLARCIIAIQPEGGEEKRFDSNLIDEKIDILTTWPTSVMDELYKVYSELSNEIDKELGFDVVEDKEASVAELVTTMNNITENPIVEEEVKTEV